MVNDQAMAAVTEPAAQHEPPFAASSLDTLPPPADPLKARREAEYDLGIRPREPKRPSRPPPGADRRGTRVVSSRRHNPFPAIPESPESLTGSGLVAMTDSGMAAASGDALAMVSTEPPDSPQRQSSSRPEGEGKGGLAAASVYSSTLDAVSSAYARVADSDPARMPTPASSTSSATAAAAAAGDGDASATRHGGMATGRPAGAKGVRVTTWSDEVTGGGPAAHGAGGDGGDGGADRGGRDSGLGSEAEELLRLVDEAFLSAKRSNADGASDAAAANVVASDAAAAGAASDPAAEPGGKAAGELLQSSSVTPRAITPRAIVTPRGGRRPQLDAEGVARVHSYKQTGRQNLKPRVPPPAPRPDTAPPPAPTLPDRAAFFAPRAPPTSRSAPSRAPRPAAPPDKDALAVLPHLSAASPTNSPTAARAGDLSAREAAAAPRPTTSPPSVISPRPLLHHDFDFVVAQLAAAHAAPAAAPEAHALCSGLPSGA